MSTYLGIFPMMIVDYYIWYRSENWEEMKQTCLSVLHDKKLKIQKWKHKQMIP